MCLFLPEGTFHIAGSVNIPSGITFKGAGQDKNTSGFFAGEKRISFIEIKESADVEVCHLTIDGLNNPMAGQGIVISKSSKINLKPSDHPELCGLQVRSVRMVFSVRTQLMQ